MSYGFYLFNGKTFYDSLKIVLESKKKIENQNEILDDFSKDFDKYTLTSSY